MREENTDIRDFSEEEEGFDFMALFFSLLAHWHWFVVSIVCCLVLAGVYLLRTPPSYNVTAAVMIKDDKKGSSMPSELSAFDDLGILSASRNFDNELEVLKSKSLLKEVVLDLNQYAVYRASKRLAKVNIYDKSPIIVEMSLEDNDNLEGVVSLEFTMNKDSTLNVSGVYANSEFSSQLNILPGLIQTPAGNLTVSRRAGSVWDMDKTLYVDIHPAASIARGYLSSSFSITPVSKTTSVAKMEFKTTNTRLGIDFLYKLVEIYNKNTNEDKNKIGSNTEQFIKDRLVIISGELGDTERQLEVFKRRSGLTDLSSDAQIFLADNSKYEQMRIENETQINLVSELDAHAKNLENKNKVLPTNIGLRDVSLAALINSYNEQILERERLMRTSSSTNPIIQNLNSTIESLYQNVLTSMASVHNGLLIKQRDLDSQVQKASNRIANAPEQERVLKDIERQQSIKSGLYLMLLEKRETNAISMAATVDDAKIIDAPQPDSTPIGPKKKLILLMGLMIGVALPIGAIYLLNLIKYKIENREDLEKSTTIPILGDIPLKDKGEQEYVVIRDDKDSMIAESFRTLRTNVRFVLTSTDQKVILFTSVSPGEGKTFTAVNLAISLAILGKKVVVCGMDIRKPRLADCFGFDRHSDGLTKYLSGEADDVFSLLQPSGVTENLKVLSAGKTPPNPAELLSSERLDEVIATLKANFDYVLIDGSPVSLVSDSLIISRVTDMSIIVTRANYTHKTDLKMINDLRKENRLPRMSIVLNAVETTSKKYGYGRYGGRYGYGDSKR